MDGISKLIENGDYEIIDCKDQNDFFKKIYKDYLDRDMVEKTFYEAILEREREFPTGLKTSTYNVALNHVDSIHVKTNALFIYKMKNDILYHQMDDSENVIPVGVVFVLLIKNHDLQVGAISEICKLWMNDELMMKLREQSNKNDVIALLKKG